MPFLISRSSIEFGDKIPSKLRRELFFGLQARFGFIARVFYCRKVWEKFGGNTSKSVSGTKVPINRKFVKPGIVFYQHLNSYIFYPGSPLKPSPHTRAISALTIAPSSQIRLLWQYLYNKVNRKMILDQYHTGIARSSEITELGYILYPQEYISTFQGVY